MNMLARRDVFTCAHGIDGIVITRTRIWSVPDLIPLLRLVSGFIVRLIGHPLTLVLLKLGMDLIERL